MKLSSAVVALGAVIASGCTVDTDSSDGTAVQVGWLLDVSSGGLAANASGFERGARLAENEINSAGGVLNRHFELALNDVAGDPTRTTAAAQKLLDNGVRIVVSSSGSNTAVPLVRDVFNQAEGILMCGVAGTSALTKLDQHDRVFRTAAPTSLEGAATAKAIYDQGHRTLSILVEEDQPFATDLAMNAESKFRELGGEVTTQRMFPSSPNGFDFEGMLKGVFANGPAAVLISGFPPGGTAILQTSAPMGFSGDWYVPGSMAAPSFLAPLGAAAEGIRSVLVTYGDGEAKTLLQNAYKKAYDEAAPATRSFENYDAVYLVALAIEQAGSTDVAAVREALRKVALPPGEVILPGQFARAKTLIAEGKDIDYQGASGPVDFDDAGDVAAQFGVFEAKSGAFEPRGNVVGIGTL
jgi:ABC-type branched-subunit amino acid transport system substrate-binding protein